MPLLEDTTTHDRIGRCVEDLARLSPTGEMTYSLSLPSRDENLWKVWEWSFHSPRRGHWVGYGNTPEEAFESAFRNVSKGK